MAPYRLVTPFDWQSHSTASATNQNCYDDATGLLHSRLAALHEAPWGRTPGFRLRATEVRRNPPKFRDPGPKSVGSVTKALPCVRSVPLGPCRHPNMPKVRPLSFDVRGKR